MKKIAFALLFILVAEFVSAQVPVGMLYDCNGFAFNGFYEPLGYSPEKKIIKRTETDEYEIGYYYTSSGEKIEGLIKYQSDKIWFKNNGQESKDIIKSELVPSFVIGVDSFYSISNYSKNNNANFETVYVQHIAAFGDYTFAKNYNFKFFHNGDPIEETYLIKSKNRQRWEVFKDKSEFLEQAISCFSSVPYIKEKYLKKDCRLTQLPSLIKGAEYFYKYQNSLSIYFDKYWQETRTVSNSIYSAKVIALNDSIWTIDFYNQGIKIHTIDYSSLCPYRKNGFFKSYFPDGSLRKIVLFKNNEIENVKIFKNSTLSKSYEYYETYETQYSEYKVIKIKYLFVSDTLNENITDLDKAIIRFIDFNQFQYVQTYSKQNLLSSYRVLNNDTIFQVTEPDNDLNIKSLETKFNEFTFGTKYIKAISENAQGCILMHFVISQKGDILETKRINSLHPEIDNNVDLFLKRLKFGIDGLYPYKFKKLKLNKKKISYEVVIPICFVNDRFYREANMFYGDNSLHFMMMQMRMNAPMNFPSPPRF